ncbi:MAG: TIGR02757 family protein [Candidatus Sabulitectum sp.]|nr:TIGR02757 family protein [Candidatus Sabulitectum sp.]
MNESSVLRDQLEEIYTRYNKREFVHPDPLEFLYRYANIEDREIAGLVASGLAYGRVNLILKSTGTVLDLLGSSPSEFLTSCEITSIEEGLENFKHRFTAGREMTAFLVSISSLQKEYGPIGNYFASLMQTMPYIEALDAFAAEVVTRMEKLNCSSGHLLPRPSRGSACKRLHLFMRWMVRHDDVDPGGWYMISASELIVPVDVHMHRVGIQLGFTKRKVADGKTAKEITDGFRMVSSDDPVKYDFALTRYGIQRLTECDLFRKLLS